MNKKLITSFVSAALVCSMGMSGVSAVTPVPTMHNNNQVTATSLSRSVADYKKIEGINDQTVLGADFTHYQQDLEWGKTYYNYKSVKIDNLFKFVQGQGINTISVKVAVNPDTASDKTKCYTLDSAIKTIKAAKEAGADFVGDLDMIQKIEKESWFDYDVIIATPEMMPMLGKIGKLLGPKGLMPNPKTGTVTMDTAKAIEETKKGKVNYRTDSFGNVHGIVGKASFDDAKLVENLKAFVEAIMKVKPSTVKGAYVKNVSISSTMGPGVKIDLNSFDK